MEMTDGFIAMRNHAMAQPESKVYGVRIFQLADGTYDWGHTMTHTPPGARCVFQWEWSDYHNEWRPNGMGTHFDGYQIKL